MAVKIAIANMKGGIGKTTTALCLADELIRRGQKVLFIDTDPQRSATSVYGADDGANNEAEECDYVNTLADIMYNDMPADKCIQHTKLGDIIASNQHLMEADTKVTVDANRFYHLSDACQGLESEYDFIIFDCPPGNGVMLGNVLSYANGVIMPITCDKFGVQGLVEFRDVMGTYMKRINPDLKIWGVLIIKYKERFSLTKDLQEELIPALVSKMGTKLYETKIRESVKCQEAQALGMSLKEYAPNCTTTLDYEAFVNELLEVEGV